MIACSIWTNWWINRLLLRVKFILSKIVSLIKYHLCYWIICFLLIAGFLLLERWRRIQGNEKIRGDLIWKTSSEKVMSTFERARLFVFRDRKIYLWDFLRLLFSFIVRGDHHTAGGGWRRTQISVSSFYYCTRRLQHVSDCIFWARRMFMFLYQLQISFLRRVWVRFWYNLFLRDELI